MTKDLEEEAREVRRLHEKVTSRYHYRGILEVAGSMRSGEQLAEEYRALIGNHPLAAESNLSPDRFLDRGEDWTIEKYRSPETPSKTKPQYLGIIHEVATAAEVLTRPRLSDLTKVEAVKGPERSIQGERWVNSSSSC